ncbi:LuxR family transcriptional regulator [Nocardia farcinica]|uniref:helix-turn-helix transcriptional regulator n=1 Tax=Nocardia farcinica TaxID=37329 RepID=UPI000DFC51FD|nr:helix-turn-helix transcriptional regulator [Nocardia farcinica]SUE28850.1 LuxR family transcriptional regulator [Nocardia farcinica]
MNVATDPVTALTALNAAVGELRRSAGLEIAPEEPAYLHTAIELADASLDAALDPDGGGLNGSRELVDCLRARAQAVEALRLAQHRRISAVSRSVQRLRGAVTVDGLIGELWAVFTTDLGFRSADFFSIEDGMVASAGKHRDATKPRPLSDAEHACLRSGQPVLVVAAEFPDTTNRAKRAVDALIAPVTVENTPVAVLYAYVAAPLTVTSTDAETAEFVATMAGRVLERILRSERLRANEQTVRTAAQRLTASSWGGSSAEIDFGSTPAITADPESDYSLLQPMVTERLTAREAEVLELIIEGASNTQIAEQLVISVETVKTHVKKVLRKLGAVNRAEAISLALLDRSRTEPSGDLPGRKRVPFHPA